jgi:hypothetical protein
MTSFAHASPASENLKRIVFPLEPDAWHGYVTETMWAEEAGAQSYRLRNVPFYALGVSFRDIVRARNEEGVLIFAEVIARGGHSTYRIILAAEPDQNTFQEFWNPLQSVGCTYESATLRLLAIDVPPEADIYQVYALLEEGESKGVWEFEEGHCGHPVRA